MAVQMNYIGRDAVLEFGIRRVRGRVKEVLFGDVRAEPDGSPRFFMGRTDIAAVILEYTEHESTIPVVPFRVQPPVPILLESAIQRECVSTEP